MNLAWSHNPEGGFSHDVAQLYFLSFQKKHNVHMYFDKDTGTWVRLPIGWELHHPMVKALVDQVEVNTKCSIIAMGYSRQDKFYL